MRRFLTGLLASSWIVGCGDVTPTAPTAGEDADSPESSQSTPAAKAATKMVLVNGKTYYLDVATSGAVAQIWFRVSPNACSVGDIKAMNLSAATTKLGKAKQQLCQLKNVYDNGRAVAGCTAIGIAGGCAVAAVATEGAAAAFCAVAFEPTLSYAFKRGAADCIDGLSDYIAGLLVGDKNWAALETGAAISEKQWRDAINSGIDTVCASAR